MGAKGGIWGHRRVLRGKFRGVLGGFAEADENEFHVVTFDHFDC